MNGGLILHCFCVAFGANCSCGLRNSKEMCNFVANLCVYYSDSDSIPAWQSHRYIENKEQGARIKD